MKDLRDRLGLSDHQAAELVRQTVARRNYGRCPHCGQPLAPVSE
jgi:hypothetical protein